MIKVIFFCITVTLFSCAKTVHKKQTDWVARCNVDIVYIGDFAPKSFDYFSTEYTSFLNSNNKFDYFYYCRREYYHYQQMIRMHSDSEGNYHIITQDNSAGIRKEIILNNHTSDIERKFKSIENGDFGYFCETTAGRQEQVSIKVDSLLVTNVFGINRMPNSSVEKDTLVFNILALMNSIESLLPDKR
jgi:hypothetical protein